MSDDTYMGVPKEDIETGERISRSPMTGTWYKVTKWVDLGDGKLKALEKEELPDDFVPEEVLSDSDSRGEIDE